MVLGRDIGGGEGLGLRNILLTFYLKENET